VEHRLQNLDAAEGLWALHCELLDLHTAFDAAEREVGAVGAVEQHGEVELPLDACPGGDHDALDDVALDVEAEDALGCRLGIRGIVCDLDAAGLASAAHLHLRLDDDRAAELLCRGADLLGGIRDDAGQNRHAIGFEEIPGLVLK